MTFLALDAGNSSVKAALWNGQAWSPVARFPSDDATPEAWAERLGGLAAPGVPSGLASVVPPLTEALVDGVRLATGSIPTRVSARLALPFDMAYRTPETLGADRIAAAAAAWRLGRGRPVVVIDAGSAVTLDAVDVRDGRGVFVGGAIAPGPRLLLRALARDTGALPAVDLAGAAPVVGDTTAEAIRAGVWGLFSGGTERLVRQTAAALASEPLVVATGGWATRLVADGLRIDRVEPTLVLDGVRLLCHVPAGRSPLPAPPIPG